MMEDVEDVLPIDQIDETSLTDLLNFREAAYASFTELAFKPIEAKLTEVVSLFLNISQPIIWSDIKSIQPETNLVSITGYTLHPIGKMIPVDNDIVEITAENVKDFKQIFRFIVDIQLLEHGSKVQLLKFIRDLAAITSNSTEAELDMLLGQYNFHTSALLTSYEFYTKILERITKPTEVAGFDTSLLTDDQMKTLFLMSNYIPGSIN